MRLQALTDPDPGPDQQAEAADPDPQAEAGRCVAACREGVEDEHGDAEDDGELEEQRVVAQHGQRVGERLDRAMVRAGQVNRERVDNTHREDRAEESFHTDQQPRRRLYVHVRARAQGRVHGLCSLCMCSL